MFFIYTVNQVKWSSLPSLKSKNTTINGQIVLPVVFDGQEIFYLKQLSESLLILMLHKYLSNNKEIDRQIINLLEGCFAAQLEEYKNEVVDVNNSNDVIGFIIKKMTIGVDFEDLTNVQLAELFHQMPYEITVQIKNIHEMFFTDPFLQLYKGFIEMLQEMAKEQKPLRKMIRKVQDVFNRMFKE